LHISDSWSHLIDACHTEGEHIVGHDKLSCNVKNSLLQVTAQFFALVVGFACHDSLFGRLAVFQIIFSHERINPDEIRDGLLAHRELMQQQSELFVIVGSCHFAIHVSELEELDCLND
jgi:hypothetical protein